ncbi:MAG: XdhC family protein, partial [Acidimicrobiales bacterium]
MQDLVALVRDSLRAAEPVAWATVIELDPQDGAEAADLPPLGAKVVVRADRDPVGSLGDPALDAVVARDL